MDGRRPDRAKRPPHAPTRLRAVVADHGPAIDGWPIAMNKTETSRTSVDSRAYSGCSPQTRSGELQCPRMRHPEHGEGDERGMARAAKL